MELRFYRKNPSPSLWSSSIDQISGVGDVASLVAVILPFSVAKASFAASILLNFAVTALVSAVLSSF